MCGVKAMIKTVAFIFSQREGMVGVNSCKNLCEHHLWATSGKKLSRISALKSNWVKF